MNAKGWILVSLLLVLVLIGVAVWKFWPAKEVAEEVPVVPSEELSGKSLYASGEYGFIVAYPERAAIEESAFTGAHLPFTWRATAMATGTPILSIVTYDRESDTSYPRFYTTAVRVGVSEDPKEVAACEKVGKDIGEEVLTDRVLNGTTWKAFSFSDAAMMRYQKGVSYRTLHDGKCYALEALVGGSNYREDHSPEDLSDAVLEAEYVKLDAVITSFTFSTP